MLKINSINNTKYFILPLNVKFILLPVHSFIHSFAHSIIRSLVRQRDRKYAKLALCPVAKLALCSVSDGTAALQQQQQQQQQQKH